MKKGMVVLAVLLPIILSGCSSNEVDEKTEKTSVSTTQASTTKEAQAKKPKQTERSEGLKESGKVQESTQAQENGQTQPASQQNNENITQAQPASQQSNDTLAQAQQAPEQETQNYDWKKTFEDTLYKNYGVTVKSYVDYGNGVFGVFVNEFDTGDNAYVTVDSATGNFHG